MYLNKKFIRATNDYSTFMHFVNAPYLRKNFEISSNIKKAEISVSGLGFYRIWINGLEITKGLFSPYISNPDHFIYFDKYNVTKYLKKGKNTFGFLLGNGFINEFAGVPYEYDLADFRSAPKLAIAFEAKYENGDSLTFEADETIKCHPSPIKLDSIRVGEYYDANLEIPNWNQPDFDDSKWTNAIPCETPRGFLREAIIDPIIKEEEMTPCNIRLAKVGKMPAYWASTKRVPFVEETRKEGYLYTFPRNRSGLFKLKIKGKKGQNIYLQFGELLDANGDLDLAPMAGAPYGFCQSANYTLKGDGIEEYIPSFTYYGYQYCLVCGITEEQATPDLLTFLVMNSKLDVNGEFKCSNNVVNELQKITLAADKSNFLHSPTDCPTREKNQWLGDACYSMEQFIFNFNVETYMHEWLLNVYASQSVEGLFHSHVPSATDWSYGQGPSTDSSGVFMPYILYKYTGNIQFLKDAEICVLKYLNYITTEVGDDYLMHSGLGDWGHVAREAVDLKAPRLFTNSAIFLETTRIAALIFDALNMEPQKHFAEEIHAKVRKAMRDRLVDFGTMTVIGNCQAAQAMAIAYKLFDPAEEKIAFDVLVKMINDIGDYMDFGTLGARVIFDVLADHGRADLAYKMITRPEFPSYGWIIGQGATTLWEDFRTIDGTNGSKNHHYWGHISAWFYKHICGIKINAFGKSPYDINIEPCFIDDLKNAECWHNATAGKIEVKWKRVKDDIDLTINYPKKASGYLKLPMGWQFEDGKAFLELKPGKQTYRLLPTYKNDKLTDPGAYGRK